MFSYKINMFDNLGKCQTQQSQFLYINSGRREGGWVAKINSEKINSIL